MVSPLVKELLESGVHFGHQTHRWNPKMKRFIFGEKNGIYLLDLEKTAEAITQAQEFLRSIASQGGGILFVGTKRQAQPIVEQEAARCHQFFVTLRWLGGLLTNFQTIRKSIERLKTLRAWREDGTLMRMTKKEAAQREKELFKLEKALSGIIEMGRLPKAIVMVDTKREETAVHEATRLGIPVVALVDTNCDPDPISYVIPGNDDAIRSIKLILSLLADAILEGHQSHLAGQEAAAAALREKDLADAAAEQAAQEAANPSLPVVTTLEEVETIVPPSVLKVEVEAAPPKKKRVAKAKPSVKEEEKEPPLG